MVIVETVELVFRLSENFDHEKDRILISTFLSINRVLRVIMVHRRLVGFTSIITAYLSKYVVKVKSIDNNNGKFTLLKIFAFICNFITILALSYIKNSNYILWFILILLKSKGSRIIFNLKLNISINYIIFILFLVREIADRFKKRSSRLSHLKRMSSSNPSGQLNTFQKDIRVENEHDLDRYIFDVVGDDEDMERIFISEEVGQDVRFIHILENVENLDFNVFELKSVSIGNELVLIINHLMEINEFFSKLNIIKDKFRKYSFIIQKMYNPVSYHNKTHAADVAQTSYYFLTY